MSRLALTTSAVVTALAVTTAHAAPLDPHAPAPFAITRYALLPPEQYDPRLHPYKGVLEILRGDAAAMKALCPKTSLNPIPLGCRVLDGVAPGHCRVIIAGNDILREAQAGPITYAFVLRHELAHCNGWSSKHEGARTFSKRIYSD